MPSGGENQDGNVGHVARHVHCLGVLAKYKVWRSALTPR